MVGITFAGNSLQTSNILTANIDHASVPAKTIKILPLAHANKSAIPFMSYPSRTITVSGKVTASSVAALDSLLDTFRSYFLLQDQNLDIDYSAGTRRFIATVNSLTINRPGNLLYAEFEIGFICTLPFGYDTASTTALNFAGRTSASYSDAYTFLGSAPYQYSVATITLTAVSSTGSQSLTWGNGGNGQGVTITRSTWASGDVVVIDCLNRKVTVNGTEVNFTGAFPEFPPGPQTITYSDTFTSRTFNYAVAYTVGHL